MTDLSLQSWGATRNLPAIFHVTSWLTAHRADLVGDEMGRQVILRGAGDEYQRSEVMQATGARFILPISFPEAPDLSDPWNTELVSLEEMKHWELAPGNPAAMDAAQIEFALTSRGAEKTFWDNMRKAVKHGLDRETALAALTSVPADMLGVSDTIGSLKPGRLASFLVADGDLFEEGSQIVQHWIAGDAYHLKQIPKDFSGEYTLRLGEDTYPLSIAGKPGKPKVSLSVQAEGAESGDEENGDDGSIDVTAALDYPAVTLSFSLMDGEAAVRLYGWMAESRWNGQGTLADGTPVAWVITPASASSEAAVAENDAELSDGGSDAESEDESDPTDQNGAITYPFAAYGRSSPVEATDMVIRNATVWTLEGEGVLEQADLLVTDGRIAAIGESIDAGDAVEIDGTGLHLTPGIVDEHAHIALLGVNDVATNSGMVRMQDVVNSEDVNIYRNLAGGVTAAQLLHGSANPIGGQSALIKMRWGSTPDEMLIRDADGFIKFALGENVKRSRNQASIRYPQSRMGVEQVYRDAFSSARDYGRAQQEWAEKSSRQRRGQTPPRRDLALDAMLEILNGERHITCHSYVQSEINMLMHVAEDYDFRVNTFTHILEGYKVADKMAQHGAGGSTFADWWAYKWEVRYAIPYNAALMAEAGVTVAINSDSREMSRRLNQEAAKSGGMSEVEALKLVTLNPAKLLHLDDRMGSLAVGKDADLVLWSHHPLSIDARALKTVVDGRVLFDAEEDERMREQIRAERARLVARIQSESSGNGKGGGNGFKRSRVFQCDSMTGYEHLMNLHGETH